MTAVAAQQPLVLADRRHAPCSMTTPRGRLGTRRSGGGRPRGCAAAGEPRELRKIITFTATEDTARDAISAEVPAGTSVLLPDCPTAS